MEFKILTFFEKKYNKIVGIGFHKTGTSSLRSALEILGFKVLGIGLI